MTKGSFQPARVIHDKDGSMFLDLPEILPDDLPTVSLVTILPPQGGKQWVGSLRYIWNSFVYPREKLEWIIIDVGTENLESYFPGANTEEVVGADTEKTEGTDGGEKSTIKYIRTTEIDGFSIRDHAVSLSSGNYIIFFEPNYYYTPDSVLGKIRVLRASAKSGILSVQNGCYTFGKESIEFNQDPNRDTNEVDLGTLGFSREYWTAHKFGTQIENFVGKRFDQFTKIPFMFNGFKIILPGAQTDDQEDDEIVLGKLGINIEELKKTYWFAYYDILENANRLI